MLKFPLHLKRISLITCYPEIVQERQNKYFFSCPFQNNKLVPWQCPRLNEEVVRGDVYLFQLKDFNIFCCFDTLVFIIGVDCFVCGRSCPYSLASVSFCYNPSNLWSLPFRCKTFQASLGHFCPTHGKGIFLGTLVFQWETVQCLWLLDCYCCQAFSVDRVTSVF